MPFIILVSVLAFTLSGCSTLHTVETGDQNSLDFRSSLGSKDDLKVGDPVSFYRLKCRTRMYGSRGPTETCSRIEAGEGTVTEVLGPASSRVRPQAGTRLEAETYVERLAK